MYDGEALSLILSCVLGMDLGMNLCLDSCVQKRRENCLLGSVGTYTRFWVSASYHGYDVSYEDSFLPPIHA